MQWKVTCNKSLLIEDTLLNFSHLEINFSRIWDAIDPSVSFQFKNRWNVDYFWNPFDIAFYCLKWNMKKEYLAVWEVFLKYFEIFQGYNRGKKIFASYKFHTVFLYFTLFSFYIFAIHIFIYIYVLFICIYVGKYI